MSLSGFYHSSWPQRENKRKQKDRQILGSCQRGEKAEKHEGDSDTNSSWYTWNCYILDLWSFMGIKNRMHPCFQVNKRQQKYHMNCMRGMPEGSVTMRYVGVGKIYNGGRFWPQAEQRAEQRREKKKREPIEEWQDVTLPWVLAVSKTTKGWEKEKCPRLSLIWKWGWS